MLIIDYNAGNPASIKNMLKKIGVSCNITSNKNDIDGAEKLILPGVGAFDYGMEELRKLELIEIIKKKVLVDKIPILGICLGAQLMGSKSDEGKLPGLGLIDMDVKRFNVDRLSSGLKIPNMGWNYIKIKKNSSLFIDICEEPRYYFVHSYHFVLNDEKDVLTTTEYGYEFASAFQHENIMGVQFHPEKSHKFGLKLLSNFIKI